MKKKQIKHTRVALGVTWAKGGVGCSEGDPVAKGSIWLATMAAAMSRAQLRGEGGVAMGKSIFILGGTAART